MWIFQFKFSSTSIPRYLKYFALEHLFLHNFSLESVSQHLRLVLKSITSVFAIFNAILLGNSMSSHLIFLDIDTLTSQILFFFSLFEDNFEMINPWKFHPSTPYNSKVIEIWKFDPFILKFGMGRFLGWEIQKSQLEDLKTNQY